MSLSIHRVWAIAAALAAGCGAAGFAAEDQQASHILEAAGVRGGLIVHLGCGDGRLAAALKANDRYLVHGLDADAEHVAAAQRHIQSRGLYGKVSVERWTGNRLPYADNLVNLLLISDAKANVAEEEIQRVLAPHGVALRLNPQSTIQKPIVTKPWPNEIDQWTHFLHGPNNNAVARDSRVGPPRRLQWVCGPLWSRSHEFASSLCAMVSARGRIFYIFDEGLTGITTDSIPQRWTLVARDGFNGLLLWKRPLATWGSSKELRGMPPTVPRLLVAQDERVLVALGAGAAVSALDAATGETLVTYEGTEGTEELRCLPGILLLGKGNHGIMAINTKTNQKLWEVKGKIQRLSWAAEGEKVFLQDGPSLVCLRADDGRELWRAPGKSSVSLLVADEDRVLLLSPAGIEAVSAATGKSLWTAATRVQRQELFAASGRLWHWEGERIVGRDPLSGEIAARLNTDEVFTPGHHLRCYQSKATENFIITPNRGAEFVSVTGDPHTQNDWLRGACRYGVMPSNGLLYVPPSPCFCYPGVKLTGFNALAAGSGSEVRNESAEAPALERGPAYGEEALPPGARGGLFAPARPAAADKLPLAPLDYARASNPQSPIPNPSDWPTYRHDARRSGTATGEVPAQVSVRWRAPLRGSLTPPVVAGDRLYVAAKDEHTLHALRADDGQRLWQFTAGGRIDSPPSLFGELVLFGCADGRVYCLRCGDGKLVWRFRAAPAERRIIAFGQLESPWRVHGSILIHDGIAYGTAGRSSYLDGGIRVFGLNPKTGEIVHQTCLDTWARTREDARNKPFVPGYHMEGAKSDILVSQGDCIYLGQVKFDRHLAQQEVPYVLADPNDRTVAMDLSKQPFTAADAEPNNDYEEHQRKWLETTQKGLLAELRRAHGSHNLGDRQIGLHVFSTAGFLDDSWFNRTYWMYSATWPGFYLAHRAAKTGQLLVVGPEKTYAVQSFPSRNLQSPLFTPGEQGYLLFADSNDNEPILDHRTRGTTKGWGFTRRQPPLWHQWVPVRIRGMVLAGRHLFVAGPPDVVQPDDPLAAFEGRKGGVLWAVSADDGKRLAELKLDAEPVFDGLIAAQGRLFAATIDGRVLCLGK